MRAGPRGGNLPASYLVWRREAKDVPRIIEETIIGGRVIEDLLIPAHKLNKK